MENPDESQKDPVQATSSGSTGVIESKNISFPVTSSKKPIQLGVVQSSLGGRSSLGNLVKKSRWDQAPECGDEEGDSKSAKSTLLEHEEKSESVKSLIQKFEEITEHSTTTADVKQTAEEGHSGPVSSQTPSRVKLVRTNFMKSDKPVIDSSSVISTCKTDKPQSEIASKNSKLESSGILGSTENIEAVPVAASKALQIISSNYDSPTDESSQEGDISSDTNNKTPADSAYASLEKINERLNDVKEDSTNEVSKGETKLIEPDDSISKITNPKTIVSGLECVEDITSDSKLTKLDGNDSSDVMTESQLSESDGASCAVFTSESKLTKHDNTTIDLSVSENNLTEPANKMVCGNEDEMNRKNDYESAHEQDMKQEALSSKNVVIQEKEMLVNPSSNIDCKILNSDTFEVDSISNSHPTASLETNKSINMEDTMEVDSEVVSYSDSVISIKDIDKVGKSQTEYVKNEDISIAECSEGKSYENITNNKLDFTPDVVSKMTEIENKMQFSVENKDQVNISDLKKCTTEEMDSCSVESNVLHGPVGIEVSDKTEDSYLQDKNNQSLSATNIQYDITTNKENQLTSSSELQVCSKALRNDDHEDKIEDMQIQSDLVNVLSGSSPLSENELDRKQVDNSFIAVTEKAPIVEELCIKKHMYVTGSNDKTDESFHKDELFSDKDKGFGKAIDSESLLYTDGKESDVSSVENKSLYNDGVDATMEQMFSEDVSSELDLPLSVKQDVEGNTIVFQPVMVTEDKVDKPSTSESQEIKQTEDKMDDFETNDSLLQMLEAESSPQHNVKEISPETVKVPVKELSMLEVTDNNKLEAEISKVTDMLSGLGDTELTTTEKIDDSNNIEETVITDSENQCAYEVVNIVSCKDNTLLDQIKNENNFVDNQHEVELSKHQSIDTITTENLKTHEKVDGLETEKESFSSESYDQSAEEQIMVSGKKLCEKNDEQIALEITNSSCSNKTSNNIKLKYFDKTSKEDQNEIPINDGYEKLVENSSVGTSVSLQPSGIVVNVSGVMDMPSDQISTLNKESKSIVKSPGISADLENNMLVDDITKINPEHQSKLGEAIIDKFLHPDTASNNTSKSSVEQLEIDDNLTLNINTENIDKPENITDDVELTSAIGAINVGDKVIESCAEPDFSTKKIFVTSKIEVTNVEKEIAVNQCSNVENKASPDCHLIESLGNVTGSEETEALPDSNKDCEVGNVQVDVLENEPLNVGNDICNENLMTEEVQQPEESNVAESKNITGTGIVMPKKCSDTKTSDPEVVIVQSVIEDRPSLDEVEISQFNVHQESTTAKLDISRTTDSNIVNLKTNEATVDLEMESSKCMSDKKETMIDKKKSVHYKIKDSDNEEYQEIVMDEVGHHSLLKTQDIDCSKSDSFNQLQAEVPKNNEASSIIFPNAEQESKCGNNSEQLKKNDKDNLLDVLDVKEECSVTNNINVEEKKTKSLEVGINECGTTEQHEQIEVIETIIENTGGKVQDFEDTSKEISTVSMFNTQSPVIDVELLVQSKSTESIDKEDLRTVSEINEEVEEYHDIKIKDSENKVLMEVDTGVEIKNVEQESSVVDKITDAVNREPDTVVSEIKDVEESHDINVKDSENKVNVEEDLTVEIGNLEYQPSIVANVTDQDINRESDTFVSEIKNVEESHDGKVKDSDNKVCVEDDATAEIRNVEQESPVVAQEKDYNVNREPKRDVNLRDDQFSLVVENEESMKCTSPVLVTENINNKPFGDSETHKYEDVIKTVNKLDDITTNAEQQVISVDKDENKEVLIDTNLGNVHDIKDTERSLGDEKQPSGVQVNNPINLETEDTPIEKMDIEEGDSNRSKESENVDLQLPMTPETVKDSQLKDCESMVYFDSGETLNLPVNIDVTDSELHKVNFKESNEYLVTTNASGVLKKPPTKDYESLKEVIVTESLSASVSEEKVEKEPITEVGKVEEKDLLDIDTYDDSESETINAIDSFLEGTSKEGKGGLVENIDDNIKSPHNQFDVIDSDKKVSEKFEVNDSFSEVVSDSESLKVTGVGTSKEVKEGLLENIEDNIISPNSQDVIDSNEKFNETIEVNDSFSEVVINDSKLLEVTEVAINKEVKEGVIENVEDNIMSPHNQLDVIDSDMNDPKQENIESLNEEDVVNKDRSSRVKQCESLEDKSISSTFGNLSNEEKAALPTDHLLSKELLYTQTEVSSNISIMVDSTEKTLLSNIEETSDKQQIQKHLGKHDKEIVKEKEIQEIKKEEKQIESLPDKESLVKEGIHMETFSPQPSNTSRQEDVEVKTLRKDIDCETKSPNDSKGMRLIESGMKTSSEILSENNQILEQLSSNLDLNRHLESDTRKESIITETKETVGSSFGVEDSNRLKILKGSDNIIKTTVKNDQEQKDTSSLASFEEKIKDEEDNTRMDVGNVKTENNFETLTEEESGKDITEAGRSVGSKDGNMHVISKEMHSDIKDTESTNIPEVCEENDALTIINLEHSKKISSKLLVDKAKCVTDKAVDSKLGTEKMPTKLEYDIKNAYSTNISEVCVTDLKESKAFGNVDHIMSTKKEHSKTVVDIGLEKDLQEKIKTPELLEKFGLHKDPTQLPDTNKDVVKTITSELSATDSEKNEAVEDFTTVQHSNNSFKKQSEKIPSKDLAGKVTGSIDNSLPTKLHEGSNREMTNIPEVYVADLDRSRSQGNLDTLLHPKSSSQTLTEEKSGKDLTGEIKSTGSVDGSICNIPVKEYKDIQIKESTHIQEVCIIDSDKNIPPKVCVADSDKNKNSENIGKEQDFKSSSGTLEVAKTQKDSIDEVQSSGSIDENVVYNVPSKLHSAIKDTPKPSNIEKVCGSSPDEKRSLEDSDKITNSKSLSDGLTEGKLAETKQVVGAGSDDDGIQNIQTILHKDIIHSELPNIPEVVCVVDSSKNKVPGDLNKLEANKNSFKELEEEKPRIDLTEQVQSVGLVNESMLKKPTKLLSGVEDLQLISIPKVCVSDPEKNKPLEESDKKQTSKSFLEKLTNEESKDSADQLESTQTVDNSIFNLPKELLKDSDSETTKIQKMVIVDSEKNKTPRNLNTVEKLKTSEPSEDKSSKNRTEVVKSPGTKVDNMHNIATKLLEDTETANITGVCVADANKSKPLEDLDKISDSNSSSKGLVQEIPEKDLTKKVQNSGSVDGDTPTKLQENKDLETVNIPKLFVASSKENEVPGTSDTSQVKENTSKTGDVISKYIDKATVSSSCVEDFKSTDHINTNKRPASQQDEIDPNVGDSPKAKNPRKRLKGTRNISPISENKTDEDLILTEKIVKDEKVTENNETSIDSNNVSPATSSVSAAKNNIKSVKEIPAPVRVSARQKQRQAAAAAALAAEEKAKSQKSSPEIISKKNITPDKSLDKRGKKSVSPMKELHIKVSSGKCVETGKQSPHTVQKLQKSEKSPSQISPKKTVKELSQDKLEPITLKLSKEDNPVIVRSSSLSPKKVLSPLSPQTKTLGYTLKIGKDSTTIIPKDPNLSPKTRDSSPGASTNKADLSGKVGYLIKDTGLTITPIAPTETQEQKLNKITLKLSKAGGHPEIKQEKSETWKAIQKLGEIDIVPVEGKITPESTKRKEKEKCDQVSPEKKIKLGDITVAPSTSTSSMSKLQGLLTQAPLNQSDDSEDVQFVGFGSPSEQQSSQQISYDIGLIKQEPDSPVSHKRRGRPRKLLPSEIIHPVSHSLPPGLTAKDILAASLQHQTLQQHIQQMQQPMSMMPPEEPECSQPMFPVPLFDLSEDTYMDPSPTIFPDQVQPQTIMRSARGRPIGRSRRPRGSGLLRAAERGGPRGRPRGSRGIKRMLEEMEALSYPDMEAPITLENIDSEMGPRMHENTGSQITEKTMALLRKSIEGKKENMEKKARRSDESEEGQGDIDAKVKEMKEKIEAAYQAEHKGTSEEKWSALVHEHKSTRSPDKIEKKGPPDLIPIHKKLEKNNSPEKKVGRNITSKEEVTKRKSTEEQTEYFHGIGKESSKRKSTEENIDITQDKPKETSKRKSTEEKSETSENKSLENQNDKNQNDCSSHTSDTNNESIMESDNQAMDIDQPPPEEQVQAEELKSEPEPPPKPVKPKPKSKAEIKRIKREKDRLRREAKKLAALEALKAPPPNPCEEDTRMSASDPTGEGIDDPLGTGIKKNRMEVGDPDGKEFTVEQIAEYQWPLQGGELYMVQEQISTYLGVKSFKRKYPDLKRRTVEMEEKTYLLESGLVSESMCDLGLTAVSSSEVLDIMFQDFQEQYEELRKYMREKATRELINKQKERKKFELSLSKSDLKEQAIQSTLSWNQALNKNRTEARRCHLDLQTWTVQYPRSRGAKMTRPTGKLGSYPVALIPGQYADYYKRYTPQELRYWPINTVLYGPLQPNERHSTGGSDGSQSESEDSSSSDDSSDSSSEGEGTCDEEERECKVCGSGGGKRSSEAVVQCSQCGHNSTTATVWA